MSLLSDVVTLFLHYLAEIKYVYILKSRDFGRNSVHGISSA